MTDLGNCTGFEDAPCRMHNAAYFDRGNGVFLCPMCNYRFNNYVEYKMMKILKEDRELKGSIDDDI